MRFKNANLFQFDPKAMRARLDGLEAAVADRTLKPCSKIEMASNGWVSPYGRDHPSLVAGMGGIKLLTLGSEIKVLPAAVVREQVAVKLAEMARERGQPVGARERRRLKEEITATLLTQAFVRPARLSAYLDSAAGWLVIDSASRKSAEGFLTVLRETLDGFAAVLPEPEESPRALMSAWLSGTKLPKELSLGDECELKDPIDRGALVRLRRQELESDEVREHLRSGKLVSQLGLVAEERLGLVLGEDLVLRKLKFLDTSAAPADEARRDGIEAEIDASFALTCLTLKPLLEQLTGWFKLAQVKAR